MTAIDIYTAKPESDSTHQIVNYTRKLYQAARDARNVRKENWLRNYKLMMNTAASSPSSSWIPKPRDSEIYPILSSIVGWMTDQTATVECTPASDPYSPFFSYWDGVSHDLELVLNTNSIVQQFDAQVKLVIWDALLFHMGIFKNCWDSTLDGGLGNTRMNRVDPWTFYPDPNATSFTDAEYFCEVRRMSLGEIYRRWPDSAKEVGQGTGVGDPLDEHPQFGGVATSNKRTNPGPISSTTGVMGGAPFNTSRGGGVYGKSITGNPYEDTTGLIPVYEFWLRQNEDWEEEDEDEPSLSEHHVQDYWRVVIIANNKILMNEKATELWSHGGHPYSRFVFEDVGEMYGVSLVDHLAQPQIYINRLLTALQQNAELIGNPIFMQGANSGLSRVSHINRPGQILTVSSASGMNRDNRPDWLKPPDMPAGVSQLVDFWIKRMENISGISGMVKGATPTGRNSQQVVSSIQDAAFVRIRSALKNLEWSLKTCFNLQADLVIEYFTERRFVAVLGPEGEKSSIVLSPRHFNVPDPDSDDQVPLKYSLVVEAGATRSTSRQARRDEADKALALGVIDEQAYLEAAHWPNYKPILDRVLKRKEQGTLNPAGARQKAGRSK